MEAIKPESVFKYFKEISDIPRGSGNTKAVSDYCVKFARERKISVTQDQWNNVIIRKEASLGREKEPGIIIQGHLDMVAEKTPNSDHDFLIDPITLMVEGDFLTAKDTTLGADDGIAVAMGLALLDDKSLSHPSLEVIFTSDEETGMDGAKNIDLSDIKGKYVLNIDSEDEGIITAGCAGGAKVKTKIPLSREQNAGVKLTVQISGLKGGHSGVEIDKERANSDILAGRLLKKLNNHMNMRLISIEGGSKDNAIPRETLCSVLLDKDSVKNAKEVIETFHHIIKKEYAGSDSDINIIVIGSEEGTFEVLSEESTNNVIFYLFNVPNGVIFMNQQIPGLVETSLNLGILKIEGNDMITQTAVRSSVATRKDFIIEKVEAVAKKVGGTISISGEYPEWEYKQESLLREKMCRIYHEMFGKELKVDVIHAGLECGYLLAKKPELDIISFGPQMYDIHTTEERLSISSTERMYDFVKKIIES